jgi:hypothetical protein
VGEQDIRSRRKEYQAQGAEYQEQEDRISGAREQNIQKQERRISGTGEQNSRSRRAGYQE